MNIFILEENLIHQQRLESFLKKITLEKGIPYKLLFSTAKAQKILDKINLASTHNLYFLNTYSQNNPHGGLVLAQKIRQKDYFSTIVFVSVHSELAIETFSYKIAALDFIDKNLASPLFEGKLTECLLRAHSDSLKRRNHDTFYFETNQTVFQIPFSDILYFETSDKPHKIKVVCKNKTTEFYGNLQEILKQDARLFQSHKSFVLNLDNIIFIDKPSKRVYFYKKKYCFVSRRKMSDLIQKISSNENSFLG